MGDRSRLSGASRRKFLPWRLIHINFARRCRCHSDTAAKESEMLDTIFLVAGAVFFALAIAYVAACDRL